MKVFRSVFLFLCATLLFLSTAHAANSPYNGWWYDADHPGSGISVEIHGNKMFAAIYTYKKDVPIGIWYTSVCSPTDEGWSGGLVYWQNGALSTVPENPVPTNAGGFYIKFYSSTEAIVGLALKGEKAISFNVKKFMPDVAPGSPDPRGLTGWWYDPNYEGSGFFLEAQGGTLFGTWYAYYADDDSQKVYPAWLSFTGRFNEQATTLDAPLISWSDGSVIGHLPYSAPVRNENETHIILTFRPDQKIDVSFLIGNKEYSKWQIERFSF